uniref:RanBD1 domain-containing protein n=1 Tax=Syphacia muris TaxID=451379 RepID=A0A0N5AG55_9BILA
MSTKKPFAFKSSALSSTADELWSASKKVFKAGDTSIKLDLGKTLAEKSKTNVRPSDAVKTSGFVFGSKITERVIVDNKDGEKLPSGDATAPTQKEKVEVQPKTASAVFESVIKKATSSTTQTSSDTLENDGASTSIKVKDTLSQDNVTAKDTAAQAKTTNVVIATGEENEVNVYHASCKVYAFDSTQKKFVERGLTNLRINRCEDTKSCLEHRIVGRGSGNQRVIINSRVFPDMLLEKISAKRLKFSAQAPDSTLPTIFLAIASEFVIEQLYTTLHDIVGKIKNDVSRKRKGDEMSDSEEKKAKSIKN